MTNNAGWARRSVPTPELDALTLLRTVGAHLLGTDEFGAVMEGSVAEGFGNRTSDVDFLLVVPDSHSSSEVPIISFANGFRTEIRRRSLPDLVTAARVINDADPTDLGQLRSISGEQLDLYQRFMAGKTVVESDELATAMSFYDSRKLQDVCCAWHAMKVLTGLRRAWLLARLNEGSAARGWIRAAVISAAKSWAARNGELYISDKWLGEQLSRIGLARDQFSRFWRFTEVELYEGAVEEAITSCVAWTGVFQCPVASEQFQLPLFDQSSALTTWQVGKTTLILQDKADLFVLSESCAVTWRSVRFKQSIGSTIETLERRSSDSQVVRDLSALSRAGLLPVTWGDGEKWTRNGAAPIAKLSSPAVTQLGLSVAAGERSPVAQVAPGSLRVVFAGCELVWANICVENGLEDLQGAREAAQWQAVISAVRRTLAWACQIVFSAAAVNPPPDRQEIVARLAELEGLPSELIDQARRLERIEVTDAVQAQAAIDQLQEFIREVRRSALVEPFPETFDSLNRWRSTLEIVIEWARLASFLDDPLSPGNRTFPIGEVRDMLGIPRSH